jgi:hypothetical protein
MSEWRPIETAPKDGTVIIVYRPEHDGKYIPRVGTDYWATFRAKRSNFSGPSWAKSRRDTQPTLWQPLPAPPGKSP